MEERMQAMDVTREAKLRELRAKTDRELMILAERMTERARQSGGEAELRAAQSLMTLAASGQRRQASTSSRSGRAAPAQCLAACC
jgi:hypothetical protein